MSKMTVQEQIDLVKKISELVDTFDSESGKELDIKNSLSKMLNALEIEKLFGFVTEGAKGRYNVESYEHIWFFGKGRCSIAWEDNGLEPNGEFLYTIGFSTGAYIFGDFYPVDLFKRFFQELKSYNPAYVDSHNDALYFKPDNAKAIFSAFPDILKKYSAMAADEYKKIRKKQLEAELEKLEAIKDEK